MAPPRPRLRVPSDCLWLARSIRPKRRVHRLVRCVSRCPSRGGEACVVDGAHGYNPVFGEARPRDRRMRAHDYRVCRVNFRPTGKGPPEDGLGRSTDRWRISLAGNRPMILNAQSCYLRLRHAAAAILAVAFTTLLGAQQPTFRSSVDVTVIDVIVVDSAGRPITDLSAADFQIRVDGRERRVVTAR